MYTVGGSITASSNVQWNSIQLSTVEEYQLEWNFTRCDAVELHPKAEPG